MALLYTKLAHLRMHNRALRSLQPKSDFRLLTTTRDGQVFSFRRQSEGQGIVVMLNLSPDPVDFSLAGDGYQGTYTDLVSGMKITLGETPCFSLPAWGYMVLVME
jgi:hypothetical protein